MNIAEIRKFVSAAVGVAVGAVALGLAPDPWDKWIPLIAGFLAALGVYRFPNDKPAVVEGPPMKAEPPVVELPPVPPTGG